MTKKLTKPQIRVIDLLTAYPNWHYEPKGVYGRGFKKVLFELEERGIITISPTGEITLT